MAHLNSMVSDKSWDHMSILRTDEPKKLGAGGKHGLIISHLSCHMFMTNIAYEQTL